MRISKCLGELYGFASQFSHNALTNFAAFLKHTGGTGRSRPGANAVTRLGAPYFGARDAAQNEGDVSDVFTTVHAAIEKHLVFRFRK
jgi:hypothetical protein